MTDAEQTGKSYPGVTPFPVFELCDHIISVKHYAMFVMFFCLTRLLFVCVRVQIMYYASRQFVLRPENL